LLYRFAATRYAGEWKVPFLLATLGAAVFADYAAAFPIPGVYPGVDYAAAVTAVDAALYVLVLYRYDVFGFTPIARESIVASLDDAIFVLDPDRRVVDFNEAAAEAFDLSGAVGEPAARALPEAVYEADPVLEGTPGSAEVSVVRDGRRVHYDVDVTTIENVEAETGYVVTLRDVTDLKESQRALERQNDRLDDFAGTVAHDLRNPLSVARTFVGDMDRDLDDDRPAAAAEALDRMDEMINELLDLARQGETVTDPEPVSLAERANGAWEVSETGDATLQVEGSRTVRADPDRLGNLLENLFRNAAEHGATEGEEPPTVYVEPTPEGFAVEDTGTGIPPERREEVFEEGFTTRPDGTGFGLAIVRSIAGAHGWTVDVVEGERAGGARFEVRI
jgi:PAS domain S-box-containing protein